MPITARAASDKISELQSKLAIYASWVELIQANYLPSDSGPPETRIEREDGGAVTAAHFGAVLQDLEVRAGELRDELAEWESLIFEPEAREPAEIDKKKVRRIQPTAK